MPYEQPLCPKNFLADQSPLGDREHRRITRERWRKTLERPVGDSLGSDQERSLKAEFESRLEKIHLGRDFLPASFLVDGADRAAAVCRISTPTSFGTGFLVARGILMTNNHVLSSVSEAAGSVAEFGLEEDGELRVSQLRPNDLFITDVALDFTIVACNATGLEEIEPVALLRNPATAVEDERVNVIQHPRGRPKEIAIHDNRVEQVLSKVVRYRTDTEPGSSGSPVFNNDWDLVALHHAGEEQPGNRALNEGIRMAAIVSHILDLSGQESSQQEGLSRIVSSVKGTHPGLGFFGVAGLGVSNLEVETRGFQGTPDFADVGVWNIEHFNSSVSDPRVRAVAGVMNDLSMDVMGLTEVQRPAMERLVNEMARQGANPDFELLNVPGSQDIAVLFDGNTTEVSLRGDIADRHMDRLTERIPSGGTAFPRFPLFADCTVRDDNDEDIRFILIVVHLKAFGGAVNQARRRLAAEILNEIVADTRSREGVPVILGGDFNETLATDVLDAISDSNNLVTLTAEDEDSGAISFVGDSHRSLIDHIFVSNDVQLGDIQNDDIAIVRLDQSVSDFAGRVSDHVPVVIRMVIDGEGDDNPPNDDPPQDGEEVIEVSIPAGATRVRVTFDA